MSDKGYLSERRENQLAKILDASIDFDKLFKGKKKLFGIINIGSALERNDRKLFCILIEYLDDNILGENATPDQSEAIEKALAFLENHDMPGFINHVALILSNEVSLPLIGSNKQMFILILQMMSELISKAALKIESLIADADAEA